MVLSLYFTEEADPCYRIFEEVLSILALPPFSFCAASLLKKTGKATFFNIHSIYPVGARSFLHHHEGGACRETRWPRPTSPFKWEEPDPPHNPRLSFHAKEYFYSYYFYYYYFYCSLWWGVEKNGATSRPHKLSQRRPQSAAKKRLNVEFSGKPFMKKGLWKATTAASTPFHLAIKLWNNHNFRAT